MQRAARTRTGEAREPLAAAEFSRAEQVGWRLRGELRAVLEALPRSGPSAMALSRDLGVDRNICQRVLAALERSENGIESLIRLPGVEGLRSFAEAALKRVPGKASRHPVRSAIDHYESLVWNLGGSQARLSDRLRAAQEVAAVARPGSDTLASTRRALSDAAARMAGLRSDVLAVVAALRPIPSNPEWNEQFGVTGNIGVESLGGSLPLVSTAASTRARLADPATEVRFSPLGSALDGSSGLIEEFSSSPLPLVTSHVGEGTFVHIVDLASRGGLRTDVVVGTHRRMIEHPTRQGEPLWNQVARVKYPAKRLLFDFYMHRQLARASVPSVAAYFLHPALSGDPIKHWHERLPGELRLELLGPGVGNAPSEAWGRQQELTRHMFERLGWPGEEFLGYRCDVTYPVWGAGYYMTFDFGRFPHAASGSAAGTPA